MANKKNGGIIPPLPLLYIKEQDRVIQDKRVLLVPVGCGNCLECRKQKARNWQIRLQEEVRTEKNGIFVTLTFKTESLKELSSGIHKLTGYELDNEIATLAVRRFLERWRKKYKKSVRHWLVTELGHSGTEHIHMHGIIWTDKGGKEIENIWKYGKIWDSDRENGWVNEQTVNYIIKYVHKIDKQHEYYKSKVFTSAGMGKKYLERLDAKLNKYSGIKTNTHYTTRNGVKLPLPTYLKNKIYTEEEREEIWLNLLDKEERYILGTKIDISENTDLYYHYLNIARQKNKRLGYGTNKKDWNKMEYELTRRNLIHLERLEKENYCPF